MYGFFTLLCSGFSGNFYLATTMSRINLEYFLARRIAFNHGGQKNNVMIRIATLSVAIGMAVMIISLAVIFGFKHEITAKLTGFGAHVQIVNLDGNTSYETVPISINQPVVPLIEKLPNFGDIHPYAIKAGILRSDDAMQGVVLKGVAADYDWTFFQDNLIEGSMPRIGDTVRYKDILISHKLAAMLQLKVDDPLEMLFIQNPPRRDRFRVRGIYDTQFDELDKMMVLTDIRNVQRLNGWDSTQITGFEITTTDFSRLEPFTDAIDDLVFNTPPAEGNSLRVINIRERYPTIFDWLNAHNVNAAVIIIVMLVVALFNMITALLIILLERTSMIGVLKALGMGNRSLQKMFIIRSSFIILKGMFWGNLLGVGLCLLQHWTGLVHLDQAGYFLAVVPIYIDWGWWALINLITFLFIVALLSLPTMIISLILPEKSIRFE